MVCAKCAKLASSSTSLATPAPKRKAEHYYGSSAAAATEKDKKASATQGNSGIGKNKLLSKAAKNPLAAFGASCDKCKTKVERGRRLCQRCAYKGNACAMCGKTNSKAAAGTGVVEGQKFSSK